MDAKIENEQQKDSLYILTSTSLQDYLIVVTFCEEFGVLGCFFVNLKNPVRAGTEITIIFDVP